METRKITAALFLLLACAAPERAGALSDPAVFEGWLEAGTDIPVELIERHPVHGGPALEFSVDRRPEVALVLPGDLDWSGRDSLAFQVSLPSGWRRPVVLVPYLKDREYNWFDGEPVRLTPGRNHELILPLSAGRGYWQAQGHYRAWDGYLSGVIRELGLRFLFDEPCEGRISIHSFDFPRDGGQPGPLYLSHYRDSGNPVARYGLYEASFRLPVIFENPYDPDSVSVEVFFRAPSGRELKVPGFFRRDYLRSLGPSGERLHAYGAGEWSIRFTPEETGRYTFRVVVRAAGKSPVSFDGPGFQSVRSERPGFVRFDSRHPEFLTLGGRDFFYPVGLTLRSPDDVRQAYRYEFEVSRGRETYTYDDYFPRMAEAGLNLARVWMAAWWTEIEWHPDYEPHYKGLGRYSQENAWKLDYVVELGARHGIYLILTLLNHGQLSARVDREWPLNPLNLEAGGFLDSPDQFFTDPRAHENFRKRLRYIVARWGYSPQIAFWEMWNEVDLTHNYNTDNVREWHREMGRYLRAIDPWDHIITTHYCRRGDPEIWRLEEMETITGNAYHQDIVNRVRAFYREREMHGKPLLINEFGHGRTAVALANNLHAGIWSSSMMTYLGPAIFWWWPFVHHGDQYGRYRALTSFWAGEDRRGMGLENAGAVVRQAGPDGSEDAEGLEAVGMTGPENAFFWVFPPGYFHDRNQTGAPPVISGARLHFRGLSAGRYRVEFWDTRSGGIIDRETLEISADGENVRLPLPLFEGDIALKLKLAGEVSGNE